MLLIPIYGFFSSIFFLFILDVFFIIIIRGDLFLMKWSVTLKAHLIFVLMDNFCLCFQFFFLWISDVLNFEMECKKVICAYSKSFFYVEKQVLNVDIKNILFLIYDDRIFVVNLYSYSVVYNKLIIQDCEIMDFCDIKCIDVISVNLYNVYCITKYILY